MTSDIAIIKDNWMELYDGKKDLPVPFQQEIFLQECHVAGTMHVDDILIKTQSLDVGSALVLKREPDNEYDELAISICTANGVHIGYVPKKYNQAYARLMDAGKLLVAKLSHKELEDHWLNLRVEIIMKDI